MSLPTAAPIALPTLLQEEDFLFFFLAARWRSFVARRSARSARRSLRTASSSIRSRRRSSASVAPSLASPTPKPMFKPNPTTASGSVWRWGPAEVAEENAAPEITTSSPSAAASAAVTGEASPAAVVGGIACASAPQPIRSRAAKSPSRPTT